jgi:hypothetical protein
MTRGDSLGVGAEVNSQANMQGLGLVPLLNAARGVYQG